MVLFCSWRLGFVCLAFLTVVVCWCYFVFYGLLYSVYLLFGFKLVFVLCGDLHCSFSFLVKFVIVCNLVFVL